MKLKLQIRAVRKRISAIGISISMIAAALMPGMSAQAANDPYAGTDFETYLNQQGFPESYKSALRELHAKYPYWKFEAQNTGLDWNTAISAESKLGLNMTESSRASSWKSTQTGAYNWDTGEWKVLDSGGWVAASTDIIKYYMDPRNFLDETNIYQFLKQSYDESAQTSEGVQNIVKGTFLAGTYEESGTKSYTDTIMQAAKVSGVSPYTLASMVIVEQGSQGTGNCIAGNVSGYEGLYNYFNIGAYASGGMTAVQRGLWYANGSGSGSTSYGRPWTSRTASIIGGSQYYGSNYVNRGQDTLYLKKYNVQGDSMYNHQYMSNVQGAVQEGRQTAKAYQSFAGETNLVFKIPVYNNMPESASVQPTGDGSPNYMLESLSINGQNLTPEFDKYKTEYTLSVGNDVENIQVAAKALDQNAAISGTGNTTLQVGENQIKVLVTAQNGTTRLYTITVTRAESPEAPDTSTPETPDTSAPETPDTSTPETPDTSTPETPDTSTPETPDTSTPETPDTSTPETPDTSTPETPDTSTPETPDTSTPETPDTSTPETPDGDDTVQQPENPDGDIYLIDTEGEVGSTVYVEATIAVDVDNIANSSIRLTYDPSALELIPEGNVTGDSGSVVVDNEISAQVAFKILAEGKHTVSVSDYQVKTNDEEALVLTKGQAVVTGLSVPSSDENPGGAGTEEGDKTPPADNLSGGNEQNNNQSQTNVDKVTVTDNTSVKTGDASNPIVYILLLAGMVVLIGVSAYKIVGRKKN